MLNAESDFVGPLAIDIEYDDTQLSVSLLMDLCQLEESGGICSGLMDLCQVRIVNRDIDSHGSESMCD